MLRFEPVIVNTKGAASHGTYLIACETWRSPPTLHLPALRLAGQTPLLRTKGWPRRRAHGTLDGRLPDHADEPLYTIPAISPASAARFSGAAKI